MAFGNILATLSQFGKEHDTGGVEFWRDPILTGWLLKQGDVVSTWRRRWFVLKEGKLFWFLDDKVTSQSKTRGVIDLRYCQSVAGAFEKTGKECSFEIACAGESKIFVAESEEVKDRWLNSIGGCIARLSYAIVDDQHVMDY